MIDLLRMCSISITSHSIFVGWVPATLIVAVFVGLLILFVKSIKE